MSWEEDPTWEGQAKLSIDLLDRIDGLVDSVESGISTARGILGQGRSALQAISALQSIGADPRIAIFEQLIGLIEDTVDAFQKEGLVHSLYIPILTQNSPTPDFEELRTRVQQAQGQAKNDEVRKRSIQVEPASLQAVDKNSDGIELDSPDELYSVYAVNEAFEAYDDIQGTAGNLGLFTRIVSSLHDKGDPNRPKFDDDDQVWCLAIVWGSTNPLAAIGDALAIDGLFSGTQSNPGANLDYPVAQNLKKEIIAGKRAGNENVGSDNKLDFIGDGFEWVASTYEPGGEGSFSVRLRWDTPSEFSGGIPFVDNVQPTKIHIYQSPGQPITEPLNQKKETIDLTELPITGGTLDVESAVISNAVFEKQRDTDYYIAVGYEWEATVAVENDNGEQEFQTRAIEPKLPNQISNQVRVNIGEQDTSMTRISGEYPDWSRLPNVVSAAPFLQEPIGEINSLIDTIESTITNNRDEINDLLNLAAQDIAEVERTLNQINNVISRLQYYLDQFETGPWIGYFSGQGGNEKVVQGMKTLLVDQSTENAPPFRTGTETVGCLVLVGGTGFSEESFDIFKTLFN